MFLFNFWFARFAFAFPDATGIVAFTLARFTFIINYFLSFFLTGFLITFVSFFLTITTGSLSLASLSLSVPSFVSATSDTASIIASVGVSNNSSTSIPISSSFFNLLRLFSYWHNFGLWRLVLLRGVRSEPYSEGSLFLVLAFGASSTFVVSFSLTRSIICISPASPVVIWASSSIINISK